MLANALATAVIVWGALASPAGTWLAWPAGVSYRPARAEAVASGPSAAALDAAGTLWLFDLSAHAFVPADPAQAAVPAPGLAQAFGVDARGLDVLDSARREVLRLGRDGRVVDRTPLPAGLTRTRRLVRVDGQLWLHTGWQESLRVPVDLPEAARDLRAWFTTRREGLLFPGARGTTVALLVEGGRARLLLRDADQGLGRGRQAARSVPLGWAGPVLAAEALGARGEGWWLRVTTGAPGDARDHLAQVDGAGRVVQAWPLPAARTLSWSDRLFVRPGGGEVWHLRPTDPGVARDVWRAR